MTAAVDGALAAIRAGKRASLYLFHGDEFLAREGVARLLEALVPAEQRTFSVEVVPEEHELASLPGRLRTGSLFGGIKVVVVYDSKAFAGKQTSGKFFDRSRAAWREGEIERALKAFLQGLAGSGNGEELLDRLTRGALPAEEARRLQGGGSDAEGESWLREMGERILRENLSLPAGSKGDPGRLYEEVLERGLPPESVLILTCEMVDERRSLFKKMKAAGTVIDVSLRSGKAYETQMSLDAARARIRKAVSEAGKTLDREAGEYLLERTGLSMRSLASELEKLLQYVGSRTKVTLADARQVLSVSREAGIFDLTNAMGGRDAARAISALRGLFAQREPAVMLLGMLASEVRTLILWRQLIDERLDGQFDPAMAYPAFQARVLPRLAAEGRGADEAAAGKTAASFQGIHPFRLYRLLCAAAAFSLDGLLDALQAIAETDLKLKTTGQPEALLMEALLLRICTI